MSPSKRVTYEEWLTMPVVDDQTEEVVDGEIRLTPPPKWKHAMIADAIARRLILQLDRSPFMVVTASFGLIVRTSPLTSRVPDVTVFERSSIVERDGYIHSAPSLIAEVLSPEFRPHERKEKIADYASLGVPEFWVISPDDRTIEVLYLEDCAYRRFGLFSEGVLAPRSFPEVQISVAQIWPD